MIILVTGANGQLGRSIRRESAGSGDTYIFTDVDSLDITDKDAVDSYVDACGADVIVNCAAFTNVDAAESAPETAMKLNATAPAILAEAAARAGATLIHISTDYVFGGAAGNTPRTETEPPAPTGVYGLTKLRGEEAVAASGAKALILRTAWLYSEFGNNFVKTMLSFSASRPELKVVFDQVGTPTYAGDLAGAIVGIITGRSFTGNEGIYHYSNEGVASWYDFTKAIVAEAALIFPAHTDEARARAACKVLPCHSNEFPSPVVRPPFSVLDKTKFKSTFGIGIPYWTDSLKICLTNLTSTQP